MTQKIRLMLVMMLAVNVASAAATGEPPKARVGNEADDAFGLHLPDPYRWMEGENNSEFTAWLNAYGVYGRAQLNAQPRLQYWQERLGAVANGGVINRLQQPMGGRIFFLRLAAGREGVLMVRDDGGSERTLLDPNVRKDSELSLDVTGFSPSADGKLIAVNVQKGGSEISEIVVLNVDNASRAPDVITDVWGEFQASWLADGSGFAYTQLAPMTTRDPKDPMLDMRVRLHRLGTSPDADPVIVARGKDPRVVMERNEFPILDVAEDSGLALLLIGGARPQLRICLASRDAVLRNVAAWNCLIGYDDNVQQFALHDHYLYTASMKDHPNGTLSLQEVDRSGKMIRESTVLAEDASAVISGLATARDALYVRRMQGGPDELQRIAYSHETPGRVPLPYSGSITLLATDPRAAGAVFTVQSWTQPRAAYWVGSGKGVPADLHLGAQSPGDYSDVSGDEISVTSADGTMVPMTILHRRDTKPPLGEIAILEGYGGYGISIQPEFDPFALEWVKAGHVYAVAHVRGGGEKGDRWRTAGSGPAKERGVEDYIACAEALVTLGWAGRRSVVAWGGSMGGILVGGAITRNPGDFSAAVIQSGELNPSRLIAAKNGANQFAEVGDPQTEQGFKSAAAMDPYQRIKPGTSYPAVLLIVGINDNRVAPWNSGKFGARLLAVSVSGNPVWFRTDADMGHFTTAQAARSRELADVFTFAEAMSAKSMAGARPEGH